MGPPASALALVSALDKSQVAAGTHVLLSTLVALLTVLLIEEHDRYYMAMAARAHFAREPPPPSKKRRRARSDVEVDHHVDLSSPSPSRARPPLTLRLPPLKSRRLLADDGAQGDVTSHDA